MQWRLGKPHPSVKKLLLRYATTGDRKVPGAAEHSQYYRKHGNPRRKRAREVTEDVDLRYSSALIVDSFPLRCHGGGKSRH